MTTDYTQLDAAILAEVALPGKHELSGIYKAIVGKLWGGIRPYWGAYQEVSNRLQSLSKRGLIAYSPKRGWSVVAEKVGA